MYRLIVLFTGLLPIVVVGVVGIGHVQGIKKNWTNEEFTVAEVMA